MVYIVEGIDRVGKTTLANKLSTKLQIPIYKHNNESFDYSLMDNTNETDKMIQLLDLYSFLSGDIIFDRFNWSDFVYGILLRSYDVERATENLRLINNKLAQLDAKIIYVQPTDIAWSSKMHGSDLSSFDYWMNIANDLTDIPIKHCTFDSIDKIIKECVQK